MALLQTERNKEKDIMRKMRECKKERPKNRTPLSCRGNHECEGMTKFGRGKEKEGRKTAGEFHKRREAKKAEIAGIWRE